MTILNAREFKDLNAVENKGFYIAISSGDLKKVKTMLQGKPDLAGTKLPNGMLPIQMAASWGHGKVVMHLYNSPDSKVNQLSEEQKIELFFTALTNNIIGKATHLSSFFFLIN